MASGDLHTTNFEMSCCKASLITSGGVCIGKWRCPSKHCMQTHLNMRRRSLTNGVKQATLPGSSNTSYEPARMRSEKGLTKRQRVFSTKRQRSQRNFSLLPVNCRKSSGYVEKHTWP